MSNEDIEILIRRAIENERLIGWTECIQMIKDKLLIAQQSCNDGASQAILKDLFNEIQAEAKWLAEKNAGK